jgi:hypothetical protein
MKKNGYWIHAAWISRSISTGNFLFTGPSACLQYLSYVNLMEELKYINFLFIGGVGLGPLVGPRHSSSG